MNAGLIRNVLDFDAGRIAQGLGLLGGEYEVIPGRPGKPAVYAADKPPEKFLAHLGRLGWIARDSRGRYSVTLLGQALLDADVDDADYEDSSVILLSKENELAYARVLGAIGGCGNALVVDAYLSSDALSHILTHTNASRFLVNHKFQPDRLTELRVLIGMSPPNDDGVVRELRQADFHDRYLIGEDKVYNLTASLNGVGGRSSALMTEMPDTPARAVRAEVEDMWQEAKVLARGLDSTDLVDEGDRADDELPKKVIRIDNDRYIHDGCEVRHRKMESAENCTNVT